MDELFSMLDDGADGRLSAEDTQKRGVSTHGVVGRWWFLVVR